MTAGYRLKPADKGWSSGHVLEQCGLTNSKVLRARDGLADDEGLHAPAVACGKRVNQDVELIKRCIAAGFGRNGAGVSPRRGGACPRATSGPLAGRSTTSDASGRLVSGNTPSRAADSALGTESRLSASRRTS